jgi:glucose/arabinose dehydrogenase
MARLRLPALVPALLFAVGCGGGGGDDDGGGNDDGGPGDDDGGGDPDDPDAAQADCTPHNGTALALELVTGDVEEPVLVTAPSGDPRLFIVEKHGRIRIFKDGALLATPFLDIDGRVQSNPAGNEQGLLGLAFHPDYASNGRFFVYYTNSDADEAISEFQVSDTDPDLADADSETPILTTPDPFANHNGGMMAFADDGFLYIGMGDGGDGDDPDGNGQDRTTLLGDMLRIDIDSGSPYGIPDDNPYVGDGGGVREEIWMSGVRNPWRWSFDRQTGDMYIGDVGQGAWEEVDVLTPEEQPGANLGWDEVEGMVCHNGGCTLGDFTPPKVVYENPAGEGRSITGGYVYRGSCFPDLEGIYFYADYVTSQVWTFKYVGGEATEQEEVTADLDTDDLLAGVSSFGEDGYGELYVVSLRPDSFGIADGAIYRIVVE